ncbi:hypothetical protein PDG61_29805 [Mycolicibacterium sp. BiH015]|uniref:hypothetical protein n=1 Tax=Mycolicibacterium sp. BiH015 TaxID=3018808 RepID=UPI0022E88BE9|nr:hypothetical protein [Mycolicibacterium sp. BiH015]MDA2895142.1 hypothetical protein [Mycolicibacterium sp. BiH015]
MVDRLSVLVGAGVITAGVSAAMLAGAGVAVASPDSTASGAGTTTAESSEPSESGDAERHDHATKGDDRTETAEDADPDEPADDSEVPDAAGQADDVDEDVVEGDDADGRGPVEDEPLADEAPAEVPTVVDDIEGAPVEEVQDAVIRVTVDVAAPESEAEAPSDAAETIEPSSAVQPISNVRALDTASEAVATPPRQTLLSLIGTVIFNIYSVAIRVLGGPPILPANSTVTVKSSKLLIDCGDGYEVPADWYVPEGVTPTRLIYFQHGFMAAGPFYSYTAARLAEATHSIVVATSLTSNFLSCDGCWVGGSPMHRAVADLFADGNTALAESALAAGYGATLLNGVDKVALIGHSAGGGLSAGAAGHMARNGTLDKLAGVVMLDGVGFGDVTPEALAELPQDFPIYNLAARAYYWNMSGVTNTAMETWRPGGFNGVKLTHSSHGDAMTGGNLFVQVAMNLVTGWPKPANVKAAEMISAGWLNDMFAGTKDSGYYGAPNQTIDIETSSGTATADVLPGPTERLTLIDRLFTFGATILFGIDFATCAADPDEVIAEMVAPNTALSLDGRTKAGQSIGQQCVHG